MKWFRLLCMASVALLGATWLKADTTEPGHFTVNLNNCTNPPTCTDFPTDPNGTGGWVADQQFTDTVNTDVNTNNFVQGTVTCTTEDNWWWDWWHEHINMTDCDDWDPYINLNPGGRSTPFPSEFNANGTGGGFFDYFNGGGPITNILFVVPNFTVGTYVCGGTLFDHCGFSTDGTNLDILFWDNPGDFVPSAVPEPSLGLLLLIALGALVAGRRFLGSRVSA